MIRALVQIKDKTSAFSLTVYAENLRRAVEVAADRYPDYEVSVLFPLDPEVFFVEGSATGSETVEPATAWRRSTFTTWSAPSSTSTEKAPG